MFLDLDPVNTLLAIVGRLASISHSDQNFEWVMTYYICLFALDPVKVPKKRVLP